MHVGKRQARARKGAGDEIVRRTPRVCITRMSREFPAPQKRDRIVHLSARRPAVHLGCEGLSEKPERRRSIAGLEVTERAVPTEVAVQRAAARIGGKPRRQEVAGRVCIALFIA